MSRLLLTTAASLALSGLLLSAAAAEVPDRAVRDEVARADQGFKAGRWREARALYEALLARRSGPSKTLHEQIARCDSGAGTTSARWSVCCPCWRGTRRRASSGSG